MIAAIIPRTLTRLDYTVIALYLAANLGIGWWCARRKNASSGDFFLGGGRVMWWAAAISFFATGTSSISFMALPAKTYQSDWLSFGSAPAQSFAGIVVGFVFVGLLRRLNLTTVFGYLEQRFNRRVRLICAGISILLKVGGRMSVVMLLPALALSTVTGLNVYASILLMGAVTTIYAMEGGFEAVIWTDVMQVGVMFGGVLVALFFLAGGVGGGMEGLIREGREAGKFHMISWNLDLKQPTMIVFLGMFLSTIFTQISDQPLMQRMLATADEREARRTVVMGNAIGMASSVIFFFIGTALFVFYQTHPDRLAKNLPNDSIFPYFIANELPAGVVGLIVAALFAAAMGALSSALNATASIIVSDFQGTMHPESKEAQRVRLAKTSTVLCGVIATGMASYLAWLNVDSLWDEFIKLTALIGGGLPGVFALGLLTRRANAAGAIIGLIAGTLVTAGVQYFTAISGFFHGFIALAVCTVVGYAASFFFPAPNPEDSSAVLTLWSAHGAGLKHK